MSRPDRRRWSWRTHLALALLVLVLVHWAGIWVAPRLIMFMAMRRIEAAGATSNQAFHAPAVDARSRTIVMPSPDMLYSLCLLDLSRGPLRVRAQPRLDSYWSVAVYEANSDNLFVRNDRQLQGRGLDLWLSAPAHRALPVPDGVTPVSMPSARGIVLLRVLTAVPEAQRALLERERRSFQCQPADAPSSGP